MTETPLTVSRLAALTGVSPRTLHHYDRIGLLRPQQRTAAGYRRYGEQELLRLQQILTLRYLGAAPIVVRGPVTGMAYSFAGGRNIQPVDARDLPGLLKKGIFRGGG